MLTRIAHVVSENIAKEQISDEYGHLVNVGEKYLICNYLEKAGTVKIGDIFKRIKTEVFVYPECIAYPFVNFQAHAKKADHFILSAKEYCDIIYYIENMSVVAQI